MCSFLNLEFVHHTYTDFELVLAQVISFYVACM